MIHVAPGIKDVSPHIEHQARVRASTRHLLDLAAERQEQIKRKIGRGWKSYDIQPETARPMRHYYSSHLSLTGSSSASCAEVG